MLQYQLVMHQKRIFALCFLMKKAIQALELHIEQDIGSQSVHTRQIPFNVFYSELLQPPPMVAMAQKGGTRDPQAQGMLYSCNFQPYGGCEIHQFRAGGTPVQGWDDKWWSPILPPSSRRANLMTLIALGL